MTIHITDDTMTSDQVPVSAEYRPHVSADGSGAWVVSWLGKRLLDRNSAITAMSLAEEVAAGRRESALAEAWIAELGLKAAEVQRLVAFLEGQSAATTEGGQS